MQEKILQIVSFDYPFPPKYGGVIDVFYKIKALHSIGYTIYLHCFVDEIPILDVELATLVKQCYFYKNKKSIATLISVLPFSVHSRYDKTLGRNLKKIEAPVLFESCKVIALLEKTSFSFSVLRLHNNESDYFFGIARSENNVFMKFNYYLEALKFKRFQKKLDMFDAVFTLSKHELNWAKTINKRSFYVPLFHGNESVANLSPFGEYAIYSGDLRTSDNKKAVQFLISVFKQIKDYQLVIAVSEGIEFIRQNIGVSTNIKVIKTDNYPHLQILLAQAHINVMVSFQESGTKLKLVNALFNSRHCLINKNMVDDQAILSLCEVANTQSEFVEKIQYLRKQSYDGVAVRTRVLSDVYDDVKNAKAIAVLLNQNN